MLGWRIQCCNPFFEVELPADPFAQVFGFHGESRVLYSLRNGVEAVGVITIQAKTFDVYRKDFTALCSSHIKGARLGIPIQRLRYTMFIHSTRINGLCMDGFARPDCQNWLNISRKLVVKLRWSELDYGWDFRGLFFEPHPSIDPLPP